MAVVHLCWLSTQSVTIRPIMPMIIALLTLPLLAAGLRSDEIARKCCPTSVDCCTLAIDKVTRMNECFPGVLEESRAASCVQRELFTKKSLQYAAFSDIECCSIFDHDHNDVGHRCRSSCISSLAVPSMSSIQKIATIQNCRQDGDRDQYHCFRSCQRWLRSSPNQNESFPIEQRCNTAALVSAGHVYLVEELPLKPHLKESVV